MNYPTDIKPLTGLRFIAAFWLLLYFFWPRLGLGDVRPNLIQSGNYGVDLFFILSGFVLAHVYGPQVEGGKYNHGTFIWARLARVYPLHILALVTMIGIWGLGKIIGADFEGGAFNLSQIPFHLTLTQAWGFVDSDGWNFPSWSISAEWFAYLTFPLSFYVVSRFKRAPIAGILMIFAAFYSAYAILAAQGFELNFMTWEGAQFRIIIAFAGGAMLWQYGRNLKTSPKFALIGVAISAIWVFAASQLTASGALVWPGLMGLVFFLAETSKHPNETLLGNKTWVYLGEISFAMYMVHLPVDIVLNQIVEKTIGQQSGIFAIIMMVVSIILVTITAVIAHEFFEKPIRNYMRENVPNFLKAKPAPIAINDRLGLKAAGEKA